MLEVPLLLLYGGSIANVHGGAAVWAQTRALIPGLLVGLMWAVVLAAISLFLACLTGRRAFATGAVAIFFLLTFTLSEILLQVESQPSQGVQPVAVKGGGPPPPGTDHVQQLVYVPGLAEKISGLFSPFTLFDGVRMWLGGTDMADGVYNPGSLGAVYALVLVIVRRSACTAWPPVTGRRGWHERACERIGKHSASANADSERQRGGLMSELASESASTVRPRMRTPSASEVAS